MARTVADGVDVIERGAADAVDVDPVRSRRARRDQRPDRRHDADPGNDYVAGDRLAAVGHHAGHAAIVAADRLDAGRQAQVDTLLAVIGSVEFRQLRTRDTCKDAVEHFDHGNVQAELAQHGRRFEPDIARADDDRAPGAGRQLALQRIDVAPRADVVNARIVAARAGQPPGIAAGGPDQLAIGNPRIV